MTTIDAVGALPALLRLSSASLPIGTFAYSGGLESAVEAGWVTSEADAGAWISTLLHNQIAYVELPLLSRLQTARATDDRRAFVDWQDVAWASRETEELREQDRHQGLALRRLLLDLHTPDIASWLDEDCGLVAAFAVCAHAWGIEGDAPAVGFAWSFAEAQVHAAVRLVPLGQTAGQRILHGITQEIPKVLATAQTVADDEIGTSLPALAIASSWHPQQYSRLFRS